jgi:putative membrane protein
VYTLKHELRATDSTADIQRLLGREQAEELSGVVYKPMFILNKIRRELTVPNRRINTSDAKLWMFDAQLDELGKALGGCAHSFCV